MAHILVIDADAAFRFMLIETLDAAGHTVSQASDGRRALKTLHAESADLVLTDLVMPEQEGIQTIKALRHLFPTLPVIAMSGALPNAPLHLEIAASLGVRRTLTKPFCHETLLNAIDEVLERVHAA